jgi:hypothetical protein
MSLVTNKMSLGEKITSIVSISSFFVAFIALTLSDDVSNLSSKAEIVTIKEAIKLKPLMNVDGYISIANLFNRGTAASNKIKVIVNFNTSVPKYELTSDEDIGIVEVKGLSLNVPLNRLSIDSNLKVTMYSSLPISYDIHYIDDSGNHKISEGVERPQRNILDIILLLVIIVSLLVIVWIYRKVSESSLLDTLESHQNEIQERLREVRDEIGNIEIVVNEPNNTGLSGHGENEKGIGQRLADFITKI